MCSDRFDTVVIGASQAGLAMGYHLARQGRRFVIVDAGDRIGQSWARRWDSLRLFTPTRFTHLPGLRFPGSPGHLPSKDEMADYLRSYAARFELPVELRSRVDELERSDEGYLVHIAERTLRADTVVVATGPAMRPRVPEFASQLDPAIRAFHSIDYRNPGQLKRGSVLIVGAGNSGAEIALDIALTHDVVLAGRDTGRIPITLGGPSYRIMNQVLTANSRLGRRFANANSGKGTPLVRVSAAELNRAGVERTARVGGQLGGRPQLQDGRVLDVQNVIWCTGYRPDYSWINLAAFAQDQPPPHRRGAVLDHPGLYFIGLPFLFRMDSSLVAGAGPDAKHIAKLIKRNLTSRASRIGA
ncbi:MAG: portal protein [Mycolicibacterium sp.]|nr:NAD(P)-binding domain-containing protein [Mycolicibacterium sp.]RUP27003.1 MAG: portal protein [Mycolicibacterium sp.]